jgi:hypothetical protein
MVRAVGWVGMDIFARGRKEIRILQYPLRECPESAQKRRLSAVIKVTLCFVLWLYFVEL